MTTLREAAQMALNDLEALVAYIKGSEPDLVMQVPAIEALRAALAQPKREWQGLTDQNYEAMAEKYVTNCYFDTLKYARAIEARLKRKNA